MCCSPNREAVSAATHLLSHEGLAHVNIRKRMLYRHCYIPSFLAQAAQNNFIQLYAKMSTVTSLSVLRIHIGNAAIENVNIIDERTSKIVNKHSFRLPLDA